MSHWLQEADTPNSADSAIMFVSAILSKAFSYFINLVAIKEYHLYKIQQ